MKYIQSFYYINISNPMNKTKRIEDPKPTAQRRPKRCNLCKRMFAVDKFDTHFANCYRFANKEKQDNKNKTNAARQNNNQNRISLPKRQIKEEKPIVVPDGNARFRIKNTSNVSQPSRFTHHSQIKVEQPQGGATVMDKKQLLQKRVVQEKIQSPVPSQLQQNQHFPSNELSQSVLLRSQDQPKLPNNSTVRIQNNLINPEDNIVQNNMRSSFYRDAVDNRLEQSQYSWEINQREIDNYPFPHIQDHPSSRSSLNHQQHIAEPQPPRQQPQQEAYDILGLIRNTNSIIEFVNSLNIRQEDETLNVMVAQLEQLNLIAQQISQLNQLGRSLAMGNIFASRIHELQTAIINQIGIALIRGFNDRISGQFQSLMMRQPDIKVGFTERQMQEMFPQKFNMNISECSICIQDLKRYDMVMQLQCHHSFHPGCIKEWLKASKKCPMCRKVQQKHN